MLLEPARSLWSRPPRSRRVNSRTPPPVIGIPAALFAILSVGVCLSAGWTPATHLVPSSTGPPAFEHTNGSPYVSPGGSVLRSGLGLDSPGGRTCPPIAVQCPLGFDRARAVPVHPGTGSVATPMVQVAFVIETTLYDGVYDPSASDLGGDFCAQTAGAAACEESNGVPFFVANAKQIAGVIQQANPKANVSFALVDYFATLDAHDDGDGAQYHVDIAQFINSNVTFGAKVASTFQATVLGGGYIYPDNEFSDNILHSSVISALYGTIAETGLNWSSAAHHVVVWMGSTAPRDPHYLENYSVSASDTNSGVSSSCEPSYNFSGSQSPACEGWVLSQDGNATDSIAQLAKTSSRCTSSLASVCTVDMIDLNATPTDPSSIGWPCNGITQHWGGCRNGTTVVTNTQHVLNAGCDLAAATGGSWDGPSYYTCSNGVHGDLAGVFVKNPYSPVLTNPSLLGAFRNVSLGPIYPGVFQEHGLPSGTVWGVNVTGSVPARTNATNLTVTGPQGIDTYAIWTANRTFWAPGGSVTLPGTGTTPPVISVNFSRLLYPVGFRERGLPPGTAWSVAVAGVSEGSTSSAITFVESNGSYTYRIDTVPGWSSSSFTGVVKVNGTAVSDTINWSQVNYTVSFEEHGLPIGTPWWINVSAIPGVYYQDLGSSSQGEMLNLTEPNGTFAFVASDSENSYRSDGGTFRVLGQNATISVPFSLVTYPVQFVEVGLPAGTTWSVSVGGIATTTMGPNITLNEPNGTYSFVLGGVSGWTPTNPARTFSVEGASLELPIQWTTTTYEVVFNEQGLAPGSSWSVTLHGSTESGPGPLTFRALPNGTYAFDVNSMRGESIEPASGSVRVNGSNAVQWVAFTSTPTTAPGFLGLPGFEGSAVLLGLAFAIIVTGVALAAIVARRRRPPPSLVQRRA